MRLIKLGLLTFILCLLTINIGYSQDQSDFKKYQIDLTLFGPAKIKIFDLACISGLGIVYKQDYWAINGQILSIQKIVGFTNRSNGYVNIDLMGGLRYEYKRIELSGFTGISLVYQRAGDSKMSGVLDNVDQSKSTIGFPIKCKFDYWISKKIAIGLLGYYNINNINSICGLSLNLGYRF